MKHKTTAGWIDPQEQGTKRPVKLRPIAFDLARMDRLTEQQPGVDVIDVAIVIDVDALARVGTS